MVDQLDDLITICGTPLVVTGQWLRDAASVATEHRLSFYDAACAAAARGLSIPLVSSDHRLISAGLAESPAALTRRLRLNPN